MKQNPELGGNRLNPGSIAKAVVWAGLVILLVKSGAILVAAGAIIMIELYEYKKTEEADWEWLSLRSPRLLVGLSLVILMAIVSQPLEVWGLVGMYITWLLWFESITAKPKPAAVLATAGISQFVSLEAIFLGSAWWHWSTIITLSLVWLTGYAVADRLLRLYNDHSRAVLATTWALIASETSWIFLVWAVSYSMTILPKGMTISIIVPQAAVVLTALGYCFGGIYLTHAAGRLNKSRLLEYLMIGLALLVMVIAGTKWNGVI